MYSLFLAFITLHLPVPRLHTTTSTTTSTTTTTFPRTLAPTRAAAPATTIRPGAGVGPPRADGNTGAKENGDPNFGVLQEPLVLRETFVDTWIWSDSIIGYSAIGLSKLYIIDRFILCT